MSSSVTPMTISRGRVPLAILAVFSLLLSLFAVVRPVAADHDVAGPAVDPVLQPGNPTCPAGTTEIKFEGGNLVEGKQLSATIDGTVVTVTITNVDVEGGTFDFSIDGGLAMTVIAKGGPNANVYNYPDGTAHDDGLVTPTNPQNGQPYGLSHISFCVVPLVASVQVDKTGPELSKATDGAPYTVTVTNTGDVDLYIESITDSLQGDLTDAGNVDSSDCGDMLAAGASCTITYTYTVGEGDADPLLNDVTVVADTAADFSGIQVTDTDSWSTELFQPGIEVTKTGDVTEAEVGDVVTYTVTIENTSSTDSPALVFDTINDSLQGDLTDAANVDTSDCGVSLAAGDSCTIVYSRTVLATDPDPLVNTVSVQSHPDGFPNDIDDSAQFQVDILAPPVGSITINKEIACEECETRTPGYWFNAAGSHDDETNAYLAAMGGVDVNIDGTNYTFTTADEVRAFLADDRSGEWDGERGLSHDGNLLRHYLSAWLNVIHNGEDCDLLSRMLGDQTVEEILAEAAAALEADDADAEVAALEKLTAINESDDADENPLTCGEGTSEAADGFMFELYAEGDYPDGDPAATGTTGDDGAGTLVFSDLPLGTYVLVETGNEAGDECEIVSVDGGILNEDGTITVTIDEETPDVVLTVVNACEGGEGEEESGDITVIKEADDDDAAAFGFSASWDADGFVLMDGDSEFSGDLVAGDYTITETLTADQIEAGWSLDDIDCGEAMATVSPDGLSVTVSLGEGESVTCTFTNELEEQGGELGTIIVAKATSDDTDADFAFTFDDDPFSLESGATATFDELAAGEYTVVELLDELDDDWSLASIECVIVDDEEPFADADATIDVETGTATVDLAAGQTVLCLFLNQMDEEQAGELGSITIVKTAVGANAATTEFDFTTTESVAGSVEDFSLLGGGNELFASLEAGTYTFTEATLTGWRLAGITCTAGGSGDLASRTATVTLAAGASVTCVFTNVAVSGGVLPGNPSQPAQPGQPAASPSARGGVLGGTLPNTAVDQPATPAPIVGLLGLLMLGGMTVLGTRAVAEARRRR